ncbi:hypothetical protein N0V90_007552 [Kalmusia sp. IMI 367209]|nr:hypothetical protein N0V90_007552 [Kalmusia sp. IMI 367209]
MATTLEPPAPLPLLFITGALGYIGGTFLTVLKRSQPSILVRALVRDSTQAETLTSFYGWTVTPVIGRLDDLELLQREAAKADIVIQACGDFRDAVLALMNGTAQNPKSQSSNATEKPIFVQISGSSNVGHPTLGENSPHVWSDVHDWEAILALEETRTSVATDNAIRKLSVQKGIYSLILAPPTILGRGLGAGRTETHQRTMYDIILKHKGAFLGGEAMNAWSTISIEDLGRACVFLLEEAMKGDNSRVQLGEHGYYFIEAFELSLADRVAACATRLYKEGRIPTADVQIKSVEEIQAECGNFAPYLFCSSSRSKADKLRALGWEPLDFDWHHLKITGPTGYVGFKTLLIILEAGQAVRAVIRRPAQAETLKSHIKIAPFVNQLDFVVVSDLAIPGAFDDKLADVVAILHIASPLANESDDYDRDIIDPAVQMCTAMLHSAKKAPSVKRVIITSSMVTLIPFSWLANPDDKTYTAADINPNPTRTVSSAMEAYWTSKALARTAAHDFVTTNKPHFDIVQILPGVIFGADDRATSVADLSNNTPLWDLKLSPILGHQ